MPRWREALLLAFIALAAIVPRVVDLAADPPSTLSWSSGIYTDEGFYTLDARHIVQFRSVAPGEFHDRIVSPLLTLVQVGLFRMVGPTANAARSVSVAFGLAAVVLLWAGLRPRGAVPAAIGALGLAAMPAAVFYNRLALQETPAAFCLACALVLVTVAERPRARVWMWWAFAGAAVVAASGFKSLSIVAAPALLWAAWVGKDRRRRVTGLAVGGLSALAVYAVVWLWPNHAVIARMDRYYALHQALPHSAGRLAHNIAAFWIDGMHGIGPYLLATASGLILLAAWPSPLRSMTAADRYAAGTLVAGVLVLMAMDYTPSRYLVLLLPALCWRAAVAAPAQRRLGGACLATFLLTSASWLGAAAQRRAATTAAASMALGGMAPAGTLAIGEFAPRLCLGTRLRAAPVQPGLSNDDHPVERLHPGLVLVTRTPYWTAWWKARYPGIVSGPPAETLAVGPDRRYIVDVYRVR